MTTEGRDAACEERGPDFNSLIIGARRNELIRRRVRVRRERREAAPPHDVGVRFQPKIKLIYNSIKLV